MARIAPISRDDVAEAAAAAIVLAPAPRQGLRVDGTPSYSFDEIAGLARIVWHPIRYAACSPSDYLRRAWAEMPNPWPHAFASLCASISQDRLGRRRFTLSGLLDRPAEGGRFPSASAAEVSQEPTSDLGRIRIAVAPCAPPIGHLDRARGQERAATRAAPTEPQSLSDPETS